MKVIETLLKKTGVEKKSSFIQFSRSPKNSVCNFFWFFLKNCKIDDINNDDEKKGNGLKPLLFHISLCVFNHHWVEKLEPRKRKTNLIVYFHVSLSLIREKVKN